MHVRCVTASSRSAAQPVAHPRQSPRACDVGYDGHASGDDLCVSGETGLMEVANLIKSFTRHKPVPGVSERLGAIQALRCE
jgi:hypothetical protein